MVLSKRLSCIASFISNGDMVADVGTDHGYLPIWLIESGVSPKVIASDIRRGPLEKAIVNAKLHDVYDKIDFRLCPGLEGYNENDADVIVIAGMGGETIINILAAAPWSNKKKLIIQPQTKIPELRSWMNDNGYEVSDACLVDDMGRIYTVWKTEAGNSRRLETWELYFDRTIFGKDDRLLRAYADELIKKIRYKIAGMERSDTDDKSELEVQKAALKSIEEIQRRLQNAKDL